MQDFPTTIIVRHPRENPKKCSVLPLKGRSDVHFLGYPAADPPSFENYIRLAADGPELSAADRECGILLLDGSWRWADKMIASFESVPPRSLHGWKTAYPRVAKSGSDPDNGLASIEALYIAYHLLGRPTAGLLDHYHWAAKFLELNGFPVPVQRPRVAMRRAAPFARNLLLTQIAPFLYLTALEKWSLDVDPPLAPRSRVAWSDAAPER